MDDNKEGPTIDPAMSTEEDMTVEKADEVKPTYKSFKYVPFTEGLMMTWLNCTLQLRAS